jgi:hypothetical protein
MKVITILLVFMLTSFIRIALAQNKDAISVNEYLVGDWVCELSGGKNWLRV